MSADNYLYIREWRGEFYVEQRFASIEYNDRKKPAVNPHGSIADALTEAARLQLSGYYEYGLSFAPSLLKVMAQL